MDMVSMWLFIGTLIGTFTRTGLPYAIKHRREKLKWEWKYLATGMLSILLSSVPIAWMIFQGIEVLPGWGILEAIGLGFAISMGITDAFNRLGIKGVLALLKKLFDAKEETYQR